MANNDNVECDQLHNMQKDAASESSTKRRRLDLDLGCVTMSEMSKTMQCHIELIPPVIDDMERRIDALETSLRLAASKAEDINFERTQDATKGKQVAASKAADINIERTQDATKELTQVQKMKTLNGAIDEQVNSAVLNMHLMYTDIIKQGIKDQAKASGLTMK